MPKAMPGLTDVRRVRAAWGRACAVTRAGKVRCWGDMSIDAARAHGPHEVWSRTVPVPGLDDARDVAIGNGRESGRGDDGVYREWNGTHYCALRSNGKVSCWGFGLWGELGNGSRRTRTRPVVVAHLDNAVQIAAAGSATCAVDKDGSVWCWGASDDAVLGPDTPKCKRKWRGPGKLETYCSAVPRRIPRLTNVVEVALGGNSSQGAQHACARTRRGEVWCWGNDYCGQHGHRDFTPVPQSHTEPRFVLEKAADIDDVVQLALAPSLSCARKGDGTVWCWGCEDGLFVPWWGDPDSDHIVRRTRPQRVPGVQKAVDLAASYNLVCARTAEGRTYCWGDNSNRVSGPARATRTPE